VSDQIIACDHLKGGRPGRMRTLEFSDIGNNFGAGVGRIVGVEEEPCGVGNGAQYVKALGMYVGT